MKKNYMGNITILILVTLCLSSILYYITNQRKGLSYDKFDHINLNSLENLTNLRKIYFDQIDKFNKYIEIDWIPRIENNFGTCYLNVVVQALCADNKFVRAIILEDFDDNAIVLRVLQIIICKLLSQKVCGIDEERKYLKEIVNTPYIFDEDGGIPYVVIITLHTYINREIAKSKYEYLQYSLTYMLSAVLSYSCSKCNYSKDKILNMITLDINSHNYKTSMIIEDFKKTNRNPWHFCKYYIPRYSKTTKSVSLPNTLCMNVPIKFYEDSRFTHYMGSPLYNIEFESVKYSLFGMIIYYKRKPHSHAAIYIKKGEKWFLVSDKSYIESNPVQDKAVTKYFRILFYKKVSNSRTHKY